jgi:hypothetical protein
MNREVALKICGWTGYISLGLGLTSLIPLADGTHMVPLSVAAVMIVVGGLLFHFGKQ